MQVNVQKLSPVLVEFDVQVGADQVQSEVNKAYAALGKRAKIRGFRPGKAPRKVLSHVYGAKVAADVAQKLVDETYPKAVSEKQLQPVSNPAFEPQALKESQPFQYKARVEVLPTIEKVTYAGLEAKRPKVEVTDEQVTEELDGLRKANATLEPLKDPRPTQKGDVVTFDLQIEVDGAPLEEAASKDVQMELGAGQLLPQLDELLQSKEAGAELETEIDMPDQHPHPGLRGKKALFKVSLKEIKERVLPEADDEFAKDMGEFDTLDALKADLRKRLEKAAKEQAENTLAERLVSELVKANPIPIPPSLVERQMSVTEQEILQQARAGGQKATGIGDELKAQVRQDSEVKVRAGLLMAEIAKTEGIKIGDAEIEEGLKELAEQTEKNVAKLRAEYREPRKREMLIGMILENKVLDIIEAKAKIEEG